jgi:nicotinamidase-related amidase
MEQNAKTKSTALLVMDVQGATLKNIKDSAAYLKPVAAAIQTARTNGIPVIYVVVGFRKGYPEVSLDNKSFSALKNNGTMNLDQEEAYRVDASIAPQPGDVLVVKKRVSAFAGSDLEVILRAYQIQHLVLLGISTSGVVLSTLREAADKDYTLTVLSDGCADMDEEVHRVLTTKVFPRQAEVITSVEWNPHH